jgi:hypothetical protein
MGVARNIGVLISLIPLCRLDSGSEKLLIVADATSYIAGLGSLGDPTWRLTTAPVE